MADDKPSPWRRCALAAALALAAAPATAHDTWFAPRPDTGAVTLALGTGNRFPLQESAIEARYLVASGCRSPARPVTLHPLGLAPAALLLRAQAPAGEPLSCWAETSAFDVELAPDKITLYLQEIQAPAAVREAWSRMRARGLAWKERYTKHARVELNPGAGAPQPVGMAMDALLESPSRTPQVGDTLQFRVLRDGRPLPEFAVELRGDRSAIGVWRKTDDEGRVRITAPWAGRWVLRGTDLRVSERNPDRWESRFVTLAFEIGAAATGRPALHTGNSLNSNTLSASQMPAMPAIANEPPASTVRR